MLTLQMIMNTNLELIPLTSGTGNNMELSRVSKTKDHVDLVGLSVLLEILRDNGG